MTTLQQDFPLVIVIYLEIFAIVLSSCKNSKKCGEASFEDELLFFLEITFHFIIHITGIYSTVDMEILCKARM